MSRRTRSGAIGQLRRNVPLFAALGDETRLALLNKLGRESPLPITRLCEGSALTRQGITKHLRVLEGAGLVKGERRGRERLFRLERNAVDDARAALDRISRQWDEAFDRLKQLVEE